ncbi:ANTAR domain-containing protein [Streptomyces sp. NPDC051133]|uniref:ANTAR domain-containing protein n=1 Tax=Streptomyces sp. NPDC051133 TaxID=3155521 RepID=UPI003418D866
MEAHDVQTSVSDGRATSDGGAGEPETVGARNRRIARGTVTAAQTVLRKRYSLASAEEAFTLLRQVSQSRNIKLHTLADAVVRSAPPAPGAASWFPGRARHAPPRLDGLDLTAHGRGQQGAVIKAALHRMLTITGTDMGDVQLAEGGLLRMDGHVGLNRGFTDFFAFVDQSTTACAQAAVHRSQVTVADVESAPVFDEESRRAILEAGSRACHSVPLLTASGGLAGMISTHHSRPLKGLTQAQRKAAEETGRAAGSWLGWHRRTLVMDALEQLHTVARTGVR